MDRKAFVEILATVAKKVAEGSHDAGLIGKGLYEAYVNGVSFLIARGEDGLPVYETSEPEPGKVVKSLTFVPAPYRYGRQFLLALRDASEGLVSPKDSARFTPILIEAAKIAAKMADVREWAPKSETTRITLSEKTGLMQGLDAFIQWYIARGGKEDFLLTAYEAAAGMKSAPTAKAA